MKILNVKKQAEAMSFFFQVVGFYFVVYYVTVSHDCSIPVSASNQLSKVERKLDLNSWKALRSLWRSQARTSKNHMGGDRGGVEDVREWGRALEDGISYRWFAA